MGGQRILDQYSWNNLRNGHLFTRLLYSDHSFWSGTCIYNFLPLISIQSPEKSVLPAADVTEHSVPTLDFASVAVVASAMLLRENELSSEQT